ncbi:MAG: hypothetical protein FWG55_01735, partial [Candidatus Bathyarchaeota archaeon]|nr:hypothetical protein [Candidatus Termiticorpusculum sp.]
MKGKALNSLLSLLLVFVLVVGCFAAMPLMANTTPDDNDFEKVEGYSDNKVVSQSQIVPAFKTLSLEPEVSIKKTIDGVAFSTWFSEHGYTDAQKDEICKSMTFDLYGVPGRNAPVPYGLPVAVGEIDEFGTIDFTLWVRANLVGISGWYVVVERLSGIAEKFFDGSVDPLYIYIGATGRIFADDFDFDALYTIDYDPAGMRALGYPGLNGGGEIFYIGVVNAETGVEYVSFCAHGNSKRFAGDNHLDCSGYVISAPAEEVGNIADYILAFNYIEAKYGKLNENRVITQTVVWALLGAIDVDSTAFANANLASDERAAIRDVLDNYKDYTGKRTIVDAVYMICEKHHDFEYCQPQIVPIYGEEHTINNRLRDPLLGSIEVSVDVVKQHDVVEVQDVYEQDWWNVYEQDWWNVYEQDWWNVYEQD